MPVSLDDHAKDLIRWWINHIDSQSNSLLTSPPHLELYTDASLTGWGAAFGNSKTGGQWTADERLHINCLELKAILLGLQSFCDKCVDTHIRIRSDNIHHSSCLHK